jgi:hypothetical protein
MHIWRKPQINCEACNAKPFLRKLNGCTEPGPVSHTAPPSDYSAYAGERVSFDRCPITIVGRDVATAVCGFILANKYLPIDSQQIYPPPYVDALSIIGREISEVEIYNASRASNG